MTERIQITRRCLLQGMGLTTVLPGLALGASGNATGARMVLMILRGAMDGLAAVQPYGDPALGALRQNLLVETTQLLKLDSFFGLHPALATFYQWYQRGELTVCHAVASPYRERSHFDGQNVLETGAGSPDQGMSGWLNRTVPYLAASSASPVIGIGQTTPKVLDGPYETTSWASAVLPAPEDDTIGRLLRLYAQDAYLGERFSQGLMTRDLADGMENGSPVTRGGNFISLARAAGGFLARDDGPAIAVLESSGWDTHANQGALQGQLALRLGELDSGMAGLQNALGSRWRDTMVLVVTEFGRTAAVNGTQGTDHGTAGAAFVLGGAVDGGRILADWPGLAPGNLYEGRDLRPTLDMRALFAGALRTQFSLDPAVIKDDILPGYGESPITL